TGLSVHSAGDCNGDGVGDLIIGSPEANNGNGAAYVVYGKAAGYGTLDASGRAVVDLGNLPALDGIVIHGAANSEIGRSVSAAGDVNGDGYSDLIVGASNASGGGQAYVLYGGQTTSGATATVDVAFVVDLPAF